MRVRTVVVLCVAAAACGSEPSPTGPTGQRVSLPSLVAGGGYVVFFRHAERDSAAITNDDLLEVDRTGACVPGSELTTRGESDSAAIGEAFRRRRIRIDRVYASPTCRTEQMARLAFGSHETTAPKFVGIRSNQPFVDIATPDAARVLVTVMSPSSVGAPSVQAGASPPPPPPPRRFRARPNP